MRVAYGRVGVRGGPLSVFIARVKGGPRPTVITDRAPDQARLISLIIPLITFIILLISGGMEINPNTHYSFKGQ